MGGFHFTSKRVATPAIGAAPARRDVGPERDKTRPTIARAAGRGQPRYPVGAGSIPRLQRRLAGAGGGRIIRQPDDRRPRESLDSRNEQTFQTAR